MAGVAVFCKEERRDDWKKADTEDTVSPCPPSEELEDLEQSGKAFKSGEEKAGSIKHIGRADTLPMEDFYD